MKLHEEKFAKAFESRETGTRLSFFFKAVVIRLAGGCLFTPTVFEDFLIVEKVLFYTRRLMCGSLVAQFSNLWMDFVFRVYNVVNPLLVRRLL